MSFIVQSGSCAGARTYIGTLRRARFQQRLLHPAGFLTPQAHLQALPWSSAYATTRSVRCKVPFSHPEQHRLAGALALRATSSQGIQVLDELMLRKSIHLPEYELLRSLPHGDLDVSAWRPPSLSIDTEKRNNCVSVIHESLSPYGVVWPCCSLLCAASVRAGSTTLAAGGCKARGRYAFKKSSMERSSLLRLCFHTNAQGVR